MKRFEYLPLGKELKAQTDISKKQLQKLDNTDEFFRIKKEKSTIKKYKRSNVIYSGRHSFYGYHNNKLLNSSQSSLESKYPFLLSFYSDLNKFNNLNSPKESTKERKVSVYDNPSELYNEYLGR